MCDTNPLALCIRPPQWMKVAACATSLLLGPLPAAALDVLPGSDLFVTPAAPGGPSATHTDFSGAPLPAGFFGIGSDPFANNVFYQGVPFVDAPLGSAQGADTLVERLAPALLPACGTSDTIPIEIVALSLQSVAPITVTFNGGLTSSDYDIDVALSGILFQPLGTMTIRHECADGGRFDSFLPVLPKLVFTKVAGFDGNPIVNLDPAPQLDFTSTDSLWAHSDLGFGVFASPGGTADSDGDGVPDAVFPHTSNFVPGVSFATCSCTSQADPKKRLTPEQAILAAHGVLPAEQTGPDMDADGIHDEADNCPATFNPIQTDRDRNCVGDACETSTPSLAAPALALLIAVLATAGMGSIVRRKIAR